MSESRHVRLNQAVDVIHLRFGEHALAAPVRAGAEFLQPAFQRVAQALQLHRHVAGDAEAVAPAPPMRPAAKHCVKIPGEAGERGRKLPFAGMPMQPCRDFAELLE